LVFYSLVGHCGRARGHGHLYDLRPINQSINQNTVYFI